MQQYYYSKRLIVTRGYFLFSLDFYAEFGHGEGHGEIASNSHRNREGLTATITRTVHFFLYAYFLLYVSMRKLQTSAIIIYGVVEQNGLV